ncbi:MAG: hypothetical protein RI590_05730 [Microbacteriaceae bacterium]|nr:hypothetical protein [Microbacteriaceae bacterium]MDR9443327.1 hypothetical protein [Microbacteriaceae bacterium]
MEKNYSKDYKNSKAYAGREKPKSPMIPPEITAEDLDISARVQLKTLSEENAEWVARHLAMTSLLIDSDPELAHKHAQAALNRAGRLAIVHETVGITAYTTGDYALALRELLTHRRLTGTNEQIPLIVDCERGMGRPQRAMDAARDVDRKQLTKGVRINLAIALSGARLDMEKPELALEELEIAELSPKGIIPQSINLFRAYADCLDELGKDSSKWTELADRAEKALAEQSAEEFELVEEIQIPEPYQPKVKYEDRKREPRGKDSRPPRKDGPNKGFRGGSRGK